MELANTVLTYYFTHAATLAMQKRFHLANRLAVWNGDERANELLESCKSWLVPGAVNDDSLAALLADVAREAEASAPDIVAYELREPFFKRYPTLISIEAELFRVRHLRVLYEIDALPAFLRRHPEAELRQLEKNLLNDPEATRVLSTWAVNFVYLLHLLVWNDTETINKEYLYSLGEGYDMQQPEQVRLLMYLYTHCIIADSNFYARPLPYAAMPIYAHMLQKLENLLADRLATTTLDTKLEFLVCCRLANYITTLERQIHVECAKSLSPEGDFIIDTHNAFAGNELKKSFEASEHRNILFALSWLPRTGSE